MPESGPFTGMRIVDASQGVAGGYCTRLLAGLGANVIKVERPGTGDVLRSAGPFVGDVPHRETSIAHLHLNSAKRSITLDIATPSGAALLRKLLETADVFVAPPDGDFSELGSSFPALIIVTVSPLGSSGPRAEWRATDIVAHAFGGYLGMTGDPDREPVKPYGDQAAYQAGLHTALGIAAALAARDGGGGVHAVDTALVEASAFLTGGAIARAHFFGRESTRNGSRPVGFPPEYLYPSVVRSCARDEHGDPGWVYVHRHNRFPDLVAALTEQPRLAEPDLLAQPLGHADETDALIDAWLAKRDKWSAVREAQELRVPFTEVLTPREVVEDRLGQLTARGALVDVDHPVAGQVRQPGAPIVMERSPWRNARAPLLGEHNREVFVDELAIDAHDLARVAAAGVI
jgi:crotonobetainyl-CoA:carnitine CoA-transferase CaiB-like acyl-CoA transferase